MMALTGVTAQRSRLAEVVVWEIDLDAVEEEERQHLATALSGTEIARAERFQHPGHGRRYVVAHGRLREILAWHSGVSPESLRFREGPRGSPELESCSIQFSVSRSQGRALVAVSRDARYLGIDVEIECDHGDLLQLARSVFSRNEIEALARVAASERLRLFLQLWTRKEAVVKALGVGLGGGLNHFDVTGDEPWRPLRRVRLPQAPTLSIVDIPSLGARAAVALDTSAFGVEIRCWPLDRPTHPTAAALEVPGTRQ